jgi:hypothetical protein
MGVAGAMRLAAPAASYERPAQPDGSDGDTVHG